MESPPSPTASAAAAARLGINVQKLHRLAAANDIHPVFRGSGRTGEKFWNPADIDRLAAALADDESVA